MKKETAAKIKAKVAKEILEGARNPAQFYADACPSVYANAWLVACLFARHAMKGIKHPMAEVGELELRNALLQEFIHDLLQDVSYEELLRASKLL